MFRSPNLLAHPPPNRIEHSMTPHAWQWLWPIVFYLIGSIPAGYLMGRSRGIDIRQHGSGNIGATNVWRVLGRKWGLLAFACDFLKGFVPLFLLRTFSFPGDNSWQVALLLCAGGLAAILGHNYTPWLGFKGGKGIATSAGAVGAIMPPVMGVALAFWIVAVLITRTVSIGSLLAAAVLPLAAAWFYPGNWIYIGAAAIGGGMAAWRHRTNIQRLIAGTESRIGSSTPKPPAP
jgi:glycerol-3-phosphate acyltransferase PlsY